MIFDSSSTIVGNLKYLSNLAENFTCSWTLKNFSLLDSRIGKRYNSPIFRLCDGNSFTLALYPGGNTASSSGFPSCFFKCFTAPKTGLYVRYTLTFGNKEGKSISICTMKSFRLISSGWGWSNIIDRKTLLEKLIDDVLILFIDGTYSSVNNAPQRDMDFPVTNPLVKLSDDLMELFETRKNADLMVSVAEEEIPVHSAILCARSPVFAAMFQHDTVECETRRVIMDDFEPEVVKSLVMFIYSGRSIIMDAKMGLELLRAADKYDLPDMMEYCTNFLIAHLDQENVLEVITAADTYNATVLRNKAIDFIYRNKRTIDFESHQSILKRKADLLFDIVKRMKKF